MSWYSEISKDIGKIPEAIDHFEKELNEARKDSKFSGFVQQEASHLPGIIEYRYSQLQEIEAILEYLNIEFRRLRSSYFKKYLENYQRALSSRDVEKYVDGESEVVDYEKIINDFALIRNKWQGVMKALDSKGFSINNVIKLKTAGMDDATV